MTCDAGSYNRRITFETITESRSSTGAVVKTWGNVPSVPTVWARVKYLRGEEYASAAIDNQGVSNQLVRFTTHYRSDITTKDRILFDGKYWNIIEVIEKGYREESEYMAEYNA